MVPDHDGGQGENGAEVAGGECFQGAQAGTPINQIPSGVSTLLLPPRPLITLTQY